MGSVLAIISKAQFEKLAGKKPVLGIVLALSEYTSTHAALEPLAEGGALYLVTVRPPDDALWLVATLLTPEKSKGAWRADANDTPITDISALKKRIRFASDTGMTAKKGTLGMSLQTPRLLTKTDANLLSNARREAIDASKKTKTATLKTATQPTAKAKPTAKAPKLSEVFVMTIDAAVSMLEESLPHPEPAKLLEPPKWTPANALRGHFTKSAQSIYAGAIDAKEATRMLEEELAPFVDGPALAMSLRHMEVTGDLSDIDGFFSDLLDQFAIRAIDDLARAILALALDRPNDIPATCTAFVPVLQERVEAVRALLR